MQSRFSRIQFIASHYSRLQGLRAVPVGILAVFISIWSLYNQGTRSNLSIPILVAFAAALLYTLTDRYYNHTFGQIRRTTSQRITELVGSIILGTLGLLAFVLDTTEVIAISCVGLVFAISFLEYFSRARPAEWGKILGRFPENIVAAIVILVISLLPLFGISWWNVLGIRSQVVGILLVVGTVIILTGIWGHVRLIRALTYVETKSDDNAV